MTYPEIYGLVVTAEPAVEPLTLAEAKLHCRVEQDFTAEDSQFNLWIKAARLYCEKRISRAFINQTLRWSLDGFPSWEVRLPRGPVASITSVIYRDTGGNNVTMDAGDYLLDADADPAVLQPDPDGYWPSTQIWRSGAVKITYVAGYGAAATAVPEPVRQAMRLLIGHAYDFREPVPSKDVGSSVDDLLALIGNGGY